MNSSNNEVVVAVMGVTGSGKSTFIRNVAENKAIYVGHGLDSGTKLKPLSDH
jgi:ABC-type proline/glycine betaine transport system ATPase subunit